MKIFWACFAICVLVSAHLILQYKYMSLDAWGSEVLIRIDRVNSEACIIDILPDKQGLGFALAYLGGIGIDESFLKLGQKRISNSINWRLEQILTGFIPLCD